MKKQDNNKNLKLHLKRERKELKKRRNPRSYRDKYNTKELKQFTFRKKIDDIIISKYKNELFDFLRAADFYGTSKRSIKIDKDFCIEQFPDNALKQIADIHTSLHVLMGEIIEIDFSNCTTTDLHTLFILRVIVNDYRKRQYDLQQKVFSKEVITQVRVIPSKNDDVNKKLFAGGILKSITTKVEQMMPISSLGMYIGDRSQKLYSENKKGITATRIVEYINNDCLSKYDFELTADDKKNMAALIAEVLNNSEDHSLHNKWYATGAFFEDNRVINDPSKEVVGELTLSILNFGQSFYEGFEATKEQNMEIYDELDSLYKKVKDVKGGDQFKKEDYFTLYALQDGVSRLKFERESRGTGTMKFINSFLGIGDYEDSHKGYCPHLTIVTGSTLLRCDNQYRSFQVDGDYYLSLNQENDLTLPPKKSHLKSLNNKFPGTVLAIKIYLNKSHLLKKFTKNGNEREES